MNNRLATNNKRQLFSVAAKACIRLTLLSVFLVACSSQPTQQRQDQVGFENDRGKFIEEVFFLTDVPQLVPVVLEVPQYPVKASRKSEGSCDVSFGLRPVAGPPMKDVQLYGTYDVRVDCPEALKGLEESCRDSVRNWHFVHERPDLKESQENHVESFCLFQFHANKETRDDDDTQHAQRLPVAEKAGRFERVERGFSLRKPFDRTFEYEINENLIHVNAIVAVIEDTVLDFSKMAARDRMLQKQMHPKTEFLIDEPVNLQLGKKEYQAFHIRTRHNLRIGDNDTKLVTDTHIIRYGNDIVHIRVSAVDEVINQVTADIDQLLKSVETLKQSAEAGDG